MSQPDLTAIRVVADRLDGLGLDYAFVGGSIVNLFSRWLLPRQRFTHARRIIASSRGRIRFFGILQRVALP